LLRGHAKLWNSVGWFWSDGIETILCPGKVGTCWNHLWGQLELEAFNGIRELALNINQRIMHYPEQHERDQAHNAKPPFLEAPRDPVEVHLVAHSCIWQSKL
jgi:hypothetical protein